MGNKNDFYIGRSYDIKSKKTLDEATLYDPDDLTTHGVVVGMTGSGKTGLCIDILEEAALQGIPALLIDPKGDITNLLLHFPDLAPQDFHPWVDADQARREGKSVEQVSSEIAEIWSKGLAQWDIDPQRIAKVRDAVDYAVYTPGSDSGIPVSILASLEAPQLAWDENRETLREKVSSTVTALLGLVGVEADPVQSREHILLSNLFERSWEKGEDFDLTELIRQIQNPPITKLGAFEVDQFYPADERFKLAMALNNLLAAPSFQAWVEGESLDVERLLWTPSGKPRQSVFYLAHLPETERMFFVTLLLTAVEAWMHAQAGSSSLRAMIYFDEVLGFLPPVAMPPSKPPLLRLLKQARAFGLGVLLTTQNPVDLDYKGLSNAGTWFVGRLQTEQDKARLLDGLEGVEVGESGFDRAKVDKTIAALGKRVFLLHNVHEKEPQIFQTRWAMAYLRGPIARTQLRELNKLVGAGVSAPLETATRAAASPKKPKVSVPASEFEALSPTKPTVAKSVGEFFLPNNLTAAQALKAEDRAAPDAKRLGLVYRPVLLAQSVARYLDRKIDLDHEETYAAIAIEPSARGVVRWDDAKTTRIELDSLDPGPAPEARFSDLEAPFNDTKILKGLQKDFLDFVYHHAALQLPSNPSLKFVGQPGMGKAEFQELCAEAAREGHEAEAEKLKDKYETKFKRIEESLTKEERELAEDEAELSSRKMEELATHAENVLGIFSGSRSRRKVTTSITKRRMTAKAKADVEESRDAIEEFQEELVELERELVDELEEIDERWSEIAAEVEETTLTPYKKNIHLELFGVAWFPFWSMQEGDEQFELPGYGM